MWGFPKMPKAPPPPPDYAPVDRERNKRLYEMGRAMRGSIQEASAMASISNGRSWELLDIRVMGLKEKRYRPSDDTFEFDFGGEVIKIAASTIAARSRDEVIEIIQRKREAAKLDLGPGVINWVDDISREFRDMLNPRKAEADAEAERMKAMAERTTKEKPKPAEPSPWDVRRIEID